jgi:hypothetical protein
MVNGTFLSPGPTSIFSDESPKYASRNFTPDMVSLKTPCGTPIVEPYAADTEIPPNKTIVKK